jgi:response regulator RpfG family c-di-GMP phosphodiesterase
MLPAPTTPRLHGRILIVSDRPQVLDELQPILAAGHELTPVADGGEAMRALCSGAVPDLVISDLGSERSLHGLEYVWRFRDVNRAGRHLVIVEEGAPCSGARLDADPANGGPTPLRRPFHADEVRATVDGAIRRMDRQMRAWRGQTWREIDRLRAAVRRAQRSVVTALAATIARGDPWMEGHAERVADLCRQVAAELRLTAADTAVLIDAALLHEIGYVGVPLELLHKLEPLTAAELERIRGHAATGGAILRQVPSLRRAATVVERQGADMDELAREFEGDPAGALLAGVLRAADAYDAITHPRAYRGALPAAHAREVLARGAGGAFHPAAVRALLRVLAAAELHHREAA